MDSDEKRLKQEDCNEDELGTGVLTLTNKRIAFDKRTSRIADFSTKMGDTVIDVPLDKVDLDKGSDQPDLFGYMADECEGMCGV